MMAPEMVGKQVQLLRELLPRVSRIAVLGNPANASNLPQLREAEVAAQALGLRLQLLEAREPDDLDRAFAAMTREHAGGSSSSWIGYSPITGYGLLTSPQRLTYRLSME